MKILLLSMLCWTGVFGASVQATQIRTWPPSSVEYVFTKHLREGGAGSPSADLWSVPIKVVVAFAGKEWGYDWNDRARVNRLQAVKVKVGKQEIGIPSACFQGLRWPISNIEVGIDKGDQEAPKITLELNITTKEIVDSTQITTASIFAPFTLSGSEPVSCFQSRSGQPGFIWPLKK